MQTRKIFPKTQRPISLVRQNRANLRAAGVTAAELQMLEEIALQCNRGSTLRFLRGSYLANCLGISRQWSNALLRRLADADLILRFKTGLIRLNLEKLHKISETTLKRARRKMLKPLKMLLKSGRGNTAFPNKEISLSKGETSPKLCRSEALAELSATYIPLHLRKNR